MNLRRLGITDIVISEVGLGTWPLGGPVQVGQEAIGRGEIEESQAIATVHAAVEAGINFFDTADIYGLGRSEEILGKAFNGKWCDNIVTTKVGKIIKADGELGTNYSPDYIRKAVERSLKRLRKDIIDIYQLHNPPPCIVCSEPLIECLDKLRAEGKIRYWGVSARLVSEAVQMVKQGFRGTTLQVVFNLLRQEAAETLFPLVHKLGIGIIVRVPLEYGVLTDKFTKKTTFPENNHRHHNLEPRLAEELDRLSALRFLEGSNERSMTLAAIRFCLSFPEVTSVIPGVREPKQVKQNVLASRFGPLSLDEISHVQNLYRNDFGVSHNHKLKSTPEEKG